MSSDQSSSFSTIDLICYGFGLFILVMFFLLGTYFLFFPRWSHPPHAAERTQSRNNMKQIGLALHNYHDVHKTFPPGAVVEVPPPFAEGKPAPPAISHHSWMSMLLPYVDQITLYNTIDFRVPWDHPANIPTFLVEVPPYLNPKSARLHIKISPGGYPVTHYSANDLLMFDNSHVAMRNIKDGSSNTVMSGEIHENFPAWGDPSNKRDLSLGINRHPDGFGGPYEGGANFLFADGHVRFISENVDPKILEALRTPAGGEAIPNGSY